MNVTLSGAARGVAQAPPSKSLAHRAVLCAALADGTSRVENLQWSADVSATLQAARDFGAHVKQIEGGAIITGCGWPKLPQGPVDCGESGSTLRFLAPILAQTGGEVRLLGHGRLPQRPQQIYADLFRQKGARFEQDDTGIRLQGPLPGGEYTLRGDVSSQFISGLLFALPLAEEDSVIRVQYPFESRSYVGLTLAALADFGVQVHPCEGKEETTFSVEGGQRYRPFDFRVEADWSNAAFPAVLGAIAGGVQVAGLSRSSAQGDAVILDILARCGASFHWDEAGRLCFEPARLQGCVIDLADCPDLGPILMVLALFCQGTTRIEHAGRLRIKESDRIRAMAAELAKFGGQVRQLDADTIEIEGCRLQAPAQPVDSHNDHRVVMACAVAALAAGVPVTLADAGAVAKSWPGFFDQLEELGAKVVRTDE